MKNNTFTMLIFALLVLIPSINFGQNNLEGGLPVEIDFCTNCSGQTPNFNLGTIDISATVGYLSSDFGPRYVRRMQGVVHYDWHGGIDYSPSPGNGDLGYRIRAIEGGRVHRIDGGSVKHIVIDGVNHDFGYLHIFDNTPSTQFPISLGGCKFVRLANNMGLGILAPDATGALRLLSDCNPCNNMHYYMDGTTPYFATNQVQAGDIIAVLGESGSEGNAHLHLNKYSSIASNVNFVNGDSYMLDPLEYVQHYSPDYDISLHKPSTNITAPENEVIGFEFLYPGSEVTKILVRPFMRGEPYPDSSRYALGTMNIDRMELLIKKRPLSDGDYKPFLGSSYESKIHMGATGEFSNKYPQYVGVTGGGNKGGWKKQGIFNFAYRDPGNVHRDPNNTNDNPYTTSGGRPYDDFYFTDIITRINKDDPADGSTTPTALANCPSEARYNDGPYNLKASVINVRGDTIDSPTQTFTLDNFQPFVQALDVWIGNTEVYSMSWQCNGGNCIEPTGGVITFAEAVNLYSLSGMRVVATCSEPMETFDIQLFIQGTEVEEAPVPTVNDDRTTFTWIYTPSIFIPILTGTVSFGRDIQFAFTGNDYSPLGAPNVGNALLDLSGYYRSDLPSVPACVTIPTRQAIGTANDWLNPSNLMVGIETTHFFGVSCGDTGGRGFEDGNVPIQCCPEITSMDTNIQPDCGSSNGSISITVETDSPDTEVRIAWSNMQTGGTITNLAAGVYTVTISTSEDCVITEDITVPGSPAGWSDEIRVGRTVECMCDATPTQAFEVTYPENEGPFYFQWTGPGGYTSTEQNPVDISVADQYYFLTVTNDAGCSRVYNMYLPACPAFNPPIEFEVFPDCGGAGGIVTANVPGWNPSQLVYQWSNGQVIPTIRNVPAGRYNVTITNTHGCSITGRVEVPDMTDTPTFITLNSTVTPACVPNTGSIALNPSGGTPPYDVDWSYPGATGSTLSFINGGSYSVTVTDNNGCAVEEYFYVGDGPMVRADVVPASCMGRADGSIHLNITGSVSNEIIWEDGNGYLNQLVRDNLAPREYCVKVTSPHGCLVRQCYDLTPTEPNTFAPYLQQVDVYAVPGGQHIYSGHWRPTSDGCVVFDGGVQAISPQLMQSMADGDISWEVGMVFSEDMESAIWNYSSVVNVTGVGTILSLSQGTPYVFNIPSNEVAAMALSGSINMGFNVSGFDTGGNPTLDMLTLSNNLTGCVKIPYLDPATCKWRPEGTSELEPPTIGPDKTHRIEFKCMSAEIVAEGNMFCLDLGDTPISDIASIRWLRPNGTSTAGLSNGCLTPTDYGTYCVRIRTHSGCEVKLCAEYCKTPEINGPTATITNPDCPGGAGGSICLDVSAAEPLFFTWSNGQQGNCIEDLSAGEYRVSITVASGCELTQGMPAMFRYEIDDNGKPLDYVSESVPACPGSANGSACVYPEDGQAPYTFVWADGGTDYCRNDLAEGCHPFTIVDACGTVLEDCVEVEEATEVAPIVEVETSVEGCNHHAMLVRVVPADVNFVATLTNGAASSFTQMGRGTFDFQNLPAGTYTLQLASRCGQNYEVGVYEVVDVPTNIQLDVASATKHPTGCDEADGSIYFRTGGPTGGAEPYIMVLYDEEGTSYPATSSGWVGLAAGDYTIVVTDANGCTEPFEVELRSEEGLIVESVITPTCAGESNGSIEILAATQANDLILYEWSSNEVFHTSDPVVLEGLAPGEYCVTITSDAGKESCIVKECFEILELSPATKLRISGKDYTERICADRPNSGFITLIVEGGVPDPFANNPLWAYNFQWSTGQNTPTNTLSGLSAGTYCVTVTDYCGNTTTGCYTLEANPPIVVDAVVRNTCWEQTNGSIALQVTGGSPPYTYSWGSPNRNNLGEGVYCVKVTDSEGCFVNKCFTIGTFPQLEASLTVVNDCAEYSSGSITVITSEGPPPFSYLWSNGITFPILAGIGTGSYSVTITDANGCDISRTAEISNGLIRADDDKPCLCNEIPVDFQDFELEIRGGLFVTGASSTSMELYVSDNNDGLFLLIDPNEYDIRWTSNGVLLAENVNQIVLSEPLQHGVSVQVTTSCRIKYAHKNTTTCGETYPQRLVEQFVRRVQNTCGGADSGEIVLSIDVEIPEEVASSIVVTGADGFSQERVLNATDSFREFEFSNLFAGTYQVTITIGNCVFEFPIVVTDNFTETRLNMELSSSFIHSEACYYDLFCDDIYVGNTVEPAARNYDDGADFPCRVPLVCNGQNIGDLGMPVLRLRALEAYEYLAVLRTQGTPFPPEVIDESISSLGLSFDNSGNPTGYEACRHVTICPATGNVTSVDYGGGFFGVDVTNDNCSRIICGTPPLPWTFFETYVYCPGEAVGQIEDIYNITSPYDPPFVSCNARCFVPLYVAIYALDFPDSWPIDFAGSQLYNEALAYQHDPRAACAKVLVCLDNYDVYYNDIGTIDCSVSLPTGLQACSLFDNEYLLLQHGDDYAGTALCPGVYQEIDPITGGWIYREGLVVRDYILSGNFCASSSIALQSQPTDVVTAPDDAVYTFGDEASNETLINIGYFKYHNLKVPKGIVSSDGKVDFYDFLHAPGRVHKVTDINPLEFIVEDWATDQSVSIVRRGDGLHHLNYQDSISIWTTEIRADNQLEVLDLLFDKGEITVVGKTNGELYVNQEKVAFEPNPFVFILRFNGTRKMLSSQILSGIDPDNTFVKGGLASRNAVEIITVQTVEGVKIDGGKMNQLTPGIWCNFSFDYASNDAKTQNPVISASFDTPAEDFSVSPDGSIRAFAWPAVQKPINFSGKNPDLSGNHLSALSLKYTDGEPIVCVNNDAEIAWVNYIESTNGSIYRKLIDFDSLHNLFVTITFTGTVGIGKHIFVSKGEHDILLVKFSPNGEVLWSRQYGGVGNESASQMLLGPNGVYLAGEFSASEDMVKLGDYLFKNSSGKSKRAFITFISDEAASSSLEEVEVELSDSPKPNSTTIRLFPNPFRDDCSLEVLSPEDDEIQVDVFDPVGRLVFTRKFNTLAGQNRYTLSSFGNFTGVLYLKVTFEKDKSVIYQKVSRNN